jgi:hypothetical protein
LLFNHNASLLAVVVAFTAISIFLIANKKTNVPAKYSFQLLYLFALPFAIGFIWSWLKKPVLQHTVLLFSAPALFLLFGHLLSILLDYIHHKILQSFILVSMAILFISPLLKQGFLKRAVTDGYAAGSTQLHAAGCHIGMYTSLYADGPKDIIDYHWNRIPNKLECEPFKYIDASTRPNLYSTLLEVFTHDQIQILVNSGSDPMLIPMLEQHYGNPTGRKSYVGTEVVSFSAKTNKKVVSFPHTFYFKSQPIGIAFKELGYQKNDVIVIQFIPSDTANVKGEIQSNITQNKHAIDWRSTNIEEQKGLANNEYYHCIKIADIPKIGPNSILECKVLDGEKYVAGVLKIRVSTGNPWLYSPF